MKYLLNIAGLVPIRSNALRYMLTIYTKLYNACCFFTSGFECGHVFNTATDGFCLFGQEH